jgi:hypothetical protein
MQWGDRDTDGQLWSMLEALGVQYEQDFGIVANVGDPDFATGAPGSPGTFLPPDHGLAAEAPASESGGSGSEA